MNPTGTIHEQNAIAITRALEGERDNGDRLAASLDDVGRDLTGRVRRDDVTPREYAMWTMRHAALVKHGQLRGKATK